MSYDLIFVRPREDESLDDAFERKCELEEADESERTPPTEQERSRWNQIAEAVERELGDPERFEGDEFLQIVDGKLGLDLSLYGGGGVSLSIAYWHEGAAAAEAMETVARCVQIVESATGLVAYDPQTETAFQGSGAQAAEGLAYGHRMLQGVLNKPKRWWQFWR